MRYVLFIIVFGLLLVSCHKNDDLPEPEGTTFLKIFNLGYYEEGNSVIQTADFGYLICGTTNSREGGSNDILLIKTDSLGISQWATLYGGNNSDRGYSAKQTTDGGYIVAGATTAAGHVDEDVFLIKTDAVGNIEWQRVFGDSIYYDEARMVLLASDGGYVIAGNGTINGESGMILNKTDALGNEVWSRIFYQDYSIECYSATVTADHGYILIGTSYYIDNKAVLIKTDSLGIEKWYKSFSVSGWADGRAVKQTSDGGYIITGTTFSGTVGEPGAIFLVKLNSSGIQQWVKTLARAISNGIDIANDDGYIIVGEMSSGQPGRNLYLAKTDASGNEVWAYTIGGKYDDWGTSVCQTADGGYVMTGAKGVIYDVDVDAYLIKTDANGLFTH
jgi:hypothetical protein